MMDSELEIIRKQIAELRSELEVERKVRKKVESMNKRLAKELSEERKGREAVERVCEELAKEMALDKAEIDRMRKEMEEERKMLRMAEVLREERVRMKLTEAKVLLEEKLLELELDFTKPKGAFQFRSSFPVDEAKAEEGDTTRNSSNTHTRSEVVTSVTSAGCGSYLNNSNSNNSNSTTSSCQGNGGGRSTSASASTVNQNQRRASPEAENPHIKRGIKGFVEYPRVVRAIGTRGGGGGGGGSHSGSKLKCQKAQLRLLVRTQEPHPIRSHNLIITS